MSPRTWVLGSASLILACTPSLSPVVTAQQGPVALFAVSSADPCGSVLPYPTDLARNPTTGTLDIPDCAGDNATTKATKAGLRTLDGWAVNTPIYAPVSKAVDQASLIGATNLLSLATATVMLIDSSKQSNPAQAFVPIDAVFMATGGPADNVIVIKPRVPLSDGVMYIVLITTGVKGTDGAALMADQVFTLAKSTTPLVDSHGISNESALSNADAYALEQLRAGLAPLFDGLAAFVARPKIASAWMFTTQTTAKTFAALSAAVSAATPTINVDSAIPASSHALLQALGLGGSLGCVYNGRIKLVNLITATGTFGVTAAGAPVTSSVEVQYLLTTPQGAACGADWTTAGAAKVAVFAHGLGRCKNDALALADNLAKAGIATLALDGPLAGARVLENLGDQNLDGCPDQPATPYLIAVGSADPNPFAIRDEMREWALELVQATGAAATNPWAFAGVTAPAGGTSTVSLVGHSWGGIAAVLAGYTAPVATVATNVASGDYGAMFQPLLTAGIAAQLQASGLDPASAAYQQALAINVATAVSTYSWVLEGADPLQFAATYPTTAKVLTQVVAAGTGAVTDASLHATATQVELAKAFDPTFDVTTSKDAFTMTSGDASVCDSSETMVGMLLQPCSAAGLAAGKTSPAACLGNAACFDYVAAQAQLDTFLASGGLLVCSLNQSGVCQ